MAASLTILVHGAAGREVAKQDADDGGCKGPRRKWLATCTRALHANGLECAHANTHTHTLAQASLWAGGCPSVFVFC
jgi:hypothetical protein